MIEGEAREVENIAANHEELCAAMKDTVFALYDSFPELRDGNQTYGRAALGADALGTYMELTPQEDMDTKKGCVRRNVASGLLMTKARGTENQSSRLTNR